MTPTTTASPMTLWQLIQRLPESLPFDKDKVEQATGMALRRREAQTNEYFWFYESAAPLLLQEAVALRTVDLRVRRDPDAGHPGFLVLQLDTAAGRCVTLAEVKDRFGALQITDAPRGRSLEDVTSHTANRPWGRLSFSFKEERPDCLASVAFDPLKKP